jgi:death-on-curing protein
LRNEPFWLTADEATEFNRLAVLATGEPFYIREPGMLESAIAAPRNRWEYERCGVPVLAATLLLAIARDHPFAQGNKRAALLSANGFLQLNGFRLIATDDEHADMILAVLNKTITTVEFVAQFVDTVAPIAIRPSRLAQARLRRKRARYRVIKVDG